MQLNAMIIIFCLAVWLFTEYLLIVFPGGTSHGRILVSQGILYLLVIPVVSIKSIWDWITIYKKTPLLILKDNLLSVKKLFTKQYIDINTKDISEIQTLDSKFGGEIKIILKQNRYYLNTNQFSLSGISIPFEVKKYLNDKNIKIRKFSTKQS